MQTASVRFHTTYELIAMDLPRVEGLLFEVQSLRSRLDGQEATLHSAIGVLQGANGPRPPRPRPHPAGSDGSGSDSGSAGTDSDASDPGGGSGPPHSDNSSNGGGGGPSGRAERERLARAKRLEAHPDVAEALNAGTISTEQADAIMKARLPSDIKCQLLADAMCETTDETLAAIRAAIVAADEGDAERKFRRQRDRRKGLCGVDEHGMTWVNIHFDPIIGAAFKELFDKEVRRQFQIDKLEPNPMKLRSPFKIGCDACAVLFGVSPQDLNVEDITADDITKSDVAGQNLASQDMTGEDFGGEDIARRDCGNEDAAGENVARQGGAGEDVERGKVGGDEPSAAGPSEAGSASTSPDRRTGRAKRASGGHRVNLTMDLAMFSDLKASAYTQTGEPVPVSILNKILCYSEILLWITDSTSTNPGRYQLVTAEPYATEVQKQGLTVRDGGCVWKGCDMRASRCDAHHLTFTREGGKSEISNLALLCPTHHTQLHQMAAHLRPGDRPGRWVLEQDLTGHLIDKWTNPPPRPPPKPDFGPHRSAEPEHNPSSQADPARTHNTPAKTGTDSACANDSTSVPDDFAKRSACSEPNRQPDPATAVRQTEPELFEHFEPIDLPPRW